MREQLALLPGYLEAHLRLSLLALGIGFAVSVPLGVWIARRPAWRAAVLGAAGVIQTIPSLALLAVMVPAIAVLGTWTSRALGFSLPSIGFLPAAIALTLYSALPILRNTVTGIAGVDPVLIEAARGVGMTGGQRLRLVELPLAMPVIVAGLRTSTVWVVGVAMLATPVGATSLGNYVFSGLQTRNFTAILVGCVAAAGLSLVLDVLIHAIETGLAQRRRAWVIAPSLGLAALALGCVIGAVADRTGARDGVVRIGSKTFTEQYILSEILAARIRGETGRPARAVQSLGSTVAFDALRHGEIDLYVDYSGTIWATILKREDPRVDRARVLEEVKRHLAREDGVTMLGSLGFENAYVLAMRGAEARREGLRSITDLAAAAPRLRIGGDYEFFARPEWRALERVYGLRFKDRRSMDASLMYQAVAAGEVDVISAFSTDGRIEAFDLATLEDDRGAIPPYDAILLLRPGLEREMPEVVRALRGLLGAIDVKTMRRMNREVDTGGASAREVARRFVATLPGGDARTAP